MIIKGGQEKSDLIFGTSALLISFNCLIGYLWIKTAYFILLASKTILKFQPFNKKAYFCQRYGDHKSARCREVIIGNPVEVRNSTRCCKLSKIFLPNPHATVVNTKPMGRRRRKGSKSEDLPQPIQHSKAFGIKVQNKQTVHHFIYSHQFSASFKMMQHDDLFISDS